MSIFSSFLKNSGVLDGSKILSDYGPLFTETEEIEVGFKMNEDTFVFTNMRLLIIQVLKGENSGIEYASLPYSQVSSFSVKAKKSFNATAFLQIWLNGQDQPKVDKEFNKSVDVYEVQKILAGHVLK